MYKIMNTIYPLTPLEGWLTSADNIPRCIAALILWIRWLLTLFSPDFSIKCFQ